MNKPLIVTWGTGEGETTLSAFDAALFEAGVANYNLIPLSSVIPEGYKPKIEKVDLNSQEYGYKLYVVKAEQTELESGLSAWAGIGWVLAETKDGKTKGLFVEHEGHSEEGVINLIKESLTSMVKYRKEKYGPVQYKVAGIKCEDNPVCAVVIAIYKSEKWE